MHKLKHKVDKDFTVVPNIIFRDNRLSFKAKGIWLQILSLPEGWNFSIAGLAKLAKEQEKAIKSAIDELIELKYLKWDKTQGADGRFTVVVVTLLPDKTPYGETSSGQNATWQNADNKELKNKECNNNKINNNTITNVIGDYGKKDINKIIEYYKQALHLPALDGTQQANRYAAQRLLDKAGGNVEAVLRLIDVLAQDDFHIQNASSIRYLEKHTVAIMQKARTRNAGGVRI